MTGPELARRQAALMAALVTGGPVPPGFDPARIGAARAALLRKRAGEAAHHWPLLAAAHGAGWTATFAAWAAGRPPRGGLRDGWDLARHLAGDTTGDTAGDTAGDRGAGPRLPAPAAAELAAREAAWRYDGRSAPRRRRLPALGRAPGAVAVQVLGRVRVWGR